VVILYCHKSHVVFQGGSTSPLYGCYSSITYTLYNNRYLYTGLYGNFVETKEVDAEISQKVAIMV
jgi:hypothetical protein